MINLRLSITNPWTSIWDAGWSWGKKLSKNKAWELQIYRSNVLLEAEVNLTHRQDHAGLKLELGLLTWCLSFNVYDTRHWNYDQGCWQTYEDVEWNT